MKIPCWKCIVVYMCSLPPIMAYLVYRRYRHDEGFKASLQGLETKLKEIRDAGEKLEAKIQAAPQKAAQICDPFDVPNHPG